MGFKNHLLQWTTKLKKHSLEIYTDGSHKRGRGSWAFVFTQNDKVVKESFGSTKKTTSLRMELQAVIEALSYLPEKSKATLFTDSRIVLEALSLNQLEIETGPNKDLIFKLQALNSSRCVVWKWVKAHSGNKYNERCDELCLQARSTP